MNMKRREFMVCMSGLLAESGTRSRAASGQETSGAVVRGLKGPFSVIDVHLHTLNTSAPNLSAAAKKYYPPDATVEELIRRMDEANIDHGFLLTYSAEDLAAEVRWRKVNPVELKPVVNRAYQINAWRRHRDRFWLFVNHSNPLRETFVEDLERDFDQGAVGWKIMPLFYGFLADHPGFLPAYELCQRRRSPIIVDLSNWHISPSRPSFGQYPLYNELPERQTLVKTFDDYARLLDPLFSQFASVPICLAHLGTPRDEQDHDAIFAFVKRHPNALLDTSPRMVRTIDFYRRIVDSVGPRKIMWGSDFIGSSSNLATWRMINECNFLSEAEKALMLSGNALRFVQGEI